MNQGSDAELDEYRFCLKTSPASTGDLGEFIVAELNRRDIPLPKPKGSSPLPATWRTFTIELEGARSGSAVAARGCSLENVANFLFSLLSPFRVHRPFSKDSDRSFWFNIDDKEGSFSRAETGLLVSFVTCEVSLKIVENAQELSIGITKHPTNPDYPG